jgi:hypothetical protein
MAVIYYSNPSEYIQSAESKTLRLGRIRTIIESLENALIDGADGFNFDSTSFDDGQTKIQSSYRSSLEIANAIERFEAIATRIENQLQGRKTILRDIKSARV